MNGCVYLSQFLLALSFIIQLMLLLFGLFLVVRGIDPEDPSPARELVPQPTLTSQEPPGTTSNGRALRNEDRRREDEMYMELLNHARTVDLPAPLTDLGELTRRLELEMAEIRNMPPIPQDVLLARAREAANRRRRPRPGQMLIDPNLLDLLNLEDQNRF